MNGMPGWNSGGPGNAVAVLGRGAVGLFFDGAAGRAGYGGSRGPAMAWRGCVRARRKAFGAGSGRTSFDFADVGFAFVGRWAAMANRANVSRVVV